MKRTSQNAGVNTPSASTGLFTRLPASVLWRIAFWTSVVGVLGGLGGTIALTLSVGAPSRDIVTGTALSVASVVILATRFRWAPAVAAVLGACNLYLSSTEPFVVESLANPKGPNGGYAHFAGDVVAVALAILAFGASAGAAVQNYRQGSPEVPRWLVPGLSVLGGMVIGALVIGALAQPATHTGTTYTNGVPTVHMTAGNFAQSSVTIATGSKLLLVDDTTSLHILANGSWQNRTASATREPGAPAVNNLRVTGNSVEIGPFATAGTYHIYCVVHPGMTLTIIVQ